jgi:hypothetical protein
VIDLPSPVVRRADAAGTTTTPPRAKASLAAVTGAKQSSAVPNPGPGVNALKENNYSEIAWLYGRPSISLAGAAGVILDGLHKI